MIKLLKMVIGDAINCSPLHVCYRLMLADTVVKKGNMELVQCEEEMYFIGLEVIVTFHVLVMHIGMMLWFLVAVEQVKAGHSHLPEFSKGEGTNRERTTAL